MTTTAQRPDSTPAAAATPRGAIDVGEIRSGADDHASVWTATRVIALGLTVIETLLLTRFALRLFGANADQQLVSFVYGLTEPLVLPFQGIFAQSAGSTLDVAAVLAVIFFLLLGALVVAGVRAVTGRREAPPPTA